MKITYATSIPLKDIIIDDSFWSKYQTLVRDTVIPYQWQALNDNVSDAESSYSVSNFKIAAGLKDGEYKGWVFQDSDLAKWIEAVGYSLEINPNPELERITDEVIEIIEKAQHPNGYLNTYFTIKEPGKQWTNLQECHELYCAGHMMEAAVSYFNATGKKKLLNAMCRFADHIDSVFGDSPDKLQGYPGHQEIELALIKMYKSTGKQRYLKLAKFFIDERGKEPQYFDIEWEKRSGNEHWPGFRNRHKRYAQSHLPAREQTTAEGHSVRATYMYSGMVDVAVETDDVELLDACRVLWDNMVNKRMYITGGIGSEAPEEAFTNDYDLPNDTAYAETCASIGLIFFAHRMLQVEQNSVYADVMEKALYNTVISGMSLDGKSFFYVNPLEVWPKSCEKNHIKHHVKVTRQKWFGCACCPPNISRLLSSLNSYIYSVKDDSIYAHLYMGNKAVFNIGGEEIRIIQKTEYPWEENIIMKLSMNSPKEFTLGLRIPGWCENAKLKVNDKVIDISENIVNGYLLLKQVWKNNDSIELVLPMPVIRIKANPAVRADIGKVALQRGPFVYCLEEEDNGNNLHQILLPTESELKVEYDDKLLGGINVIKADALRIDTSSWKDELYRTNTSTKYSPAGVKFIPYYAWANRKPGEMTVWILEVRCFGVTPI